MYDHVQFKVTSNARQMQWFFETYTFLFNHAETFIVPHTHSHSRLFTGGGWGVFSDTTATTTQMSSTLPPCHVSSG